MSHDCDGADTSALKQKITEMEEERLQFDKGQKELLLKEQEEDEAKDVEVKQKKQKTEKTEKKPKAEKKPKSESKKTVDPSGNKVASLRCLLPILCLPRSSAPRRRSRRPPALTSLS